MTVIDCRGLKCPLPVLRLEKALAEAEPGFALEVLATDPVARVDIPLYCRQNGHTCTVTEGDGVLWFEIVVGE